MKLIVIGFFVILLSQAANGQSAGESLSAKIAQRMTDSLQLTNAQQLSIYQLNMQLHNEKMQLRQQDQNNTTLGFLLQQVEKKRDSLYHTVLNEAQFLDYKAKKLRLMNN